MRYGHSISRGEGRRQWTGGVEGGMMIQAPILSKMAKCGVVNKRGEKKVKMGEDWERGGNLGLSTRRKCAPAPPGTFHGLHRCLTSKSSIDDVKPIRRVFDLFGHFLFRSHAQSSYSVLCFPEVRQYRSDTGVFVEYLYRATVLLYLKDINCRHSL